MNLASIILILQLALSLLTTASNNPNAAKEDKQRAFAMANTAISLATQAMQTPTEVMSTPNRTGDAGNQTNSSSSNNFTNQLVADEFAPVVGDNSYMNPADGIISDSKLNLKLNTLKGKVLELHYLGQPLYYIIDSNDATSIDVSAGGFNGLPTGFYTYRIVSRDSEEVKDVHIIGESNPNTPIPPKPNPVCFYQNSDFNNPNCVRGGGYRAQE